MQYFHESRDGFEETEKEKKAKFNVDVGCDPEIGLCSAPLAIGTGYKFGIKWVPNEWDFGKEACFLFSFPHSCLISSVFSVATQDGPKKMLQENSRESWGLKECFRVMQKKEKEKTFPPSMVREWILQEGCTEDIF